MTGSFVVDNSVVMAWCFSDESNEKTEGLLDRLLDGKAYVPSIWPLEVANVLLVAERKKRIGEADTSRFLTLLARLPIVVDRENSTSVHEMVMLARNHGLTSYDASYLDLAMKRGLPLATQDKTLIQAAMKCNVILI
jgi:predicted nucleic acid-binding protein